MAIRDQKITDRYALYCGDCMEVLPKITGDKIHLSVYSPPFGGLYHYSSSERDLSNCDSYEDFFNHYSYILRELYRVTMPGRMTAVHCADIPTGNTGNDSMIDFTGDVIRAHEKEKWLYVARYAVWKDAFTVRNRTMAKCLAHKQIVDDASRCSNAAADYLLVFRKRGENPEPIAHPRGFTDYAGARNVPAELLKYKGWDGNQIENRYSHWIWRQYAAAFWDDIRPNHVLPFRESRDEEDEKHVHPLQLDIIERVIILWSNPGNIVLTPFMGVGSEVYVAKELGRRGIGIELKPSYYRQALKNMEHEIENPAQLFDDVDDEFGTIAEGITI
ncbi:MAG: site-specific DNA-methyltransferase [bacterium]